MSKALVIKGANFSTNKLDTVVVSDPVPCTSITVSPSTLTMTTVGATSQLTASILPADTTDSVLWSSSDANIASVSDSGLVTCVGLGSATITATCGSHSATCAVTVAITINANTDLAYVNGYCVSSTDLSVDPPKDIVGAYATSRGRMYADANNTLGGYTAFATSVEALDPLYPIAIPANTKYIHCTYPSGFYRIGYTLINANEHCTYGSADTALAVYFVGLVQVAGEYTIDLTGYDEANSFVVSFQTSNADGSSITGDVTFEFLAE